MRFVPVAAATRGPMMSVTRVAKEPLIGVVDDDESVRESLPFLLAELGYATHAFASAEEFLASDVISRTECLILDVMMPGMTGPQLQSELKVRGHHIPIVFITAHGDEKMRLQAMRGGAVGFLAKPFDSGILLDRVRAALEAGSGGNGLV